MQIVLLERIAKLGQMGEVVTVKDGYARNFLLPAGKAMRANKANLAQFEGQRVQLEAQNLDRKTDAEAVKVKMDGHEIVIIRQSGETGQLYGSVNTRDIAGGLTETGFETNKNQVITRPVWELMFNLPMYKNCQRDNQTNAKFLQERTVNIPSGSRI